MSRQPHLHHSTKKHRRKPVSLQKRQEKKSIITGDSKRVVMVREEIILENKCRGVVLV
jgi:hypothetical protein